MSGVEDTMPPTGWVIYGVTAKELEALCVALARQAAAVASTGYGAAEEAASLDAGRADGHPRSPHRRGLGARGAGGR